MRDTPGGNGANIARGILLAAPVALRTSMRQFRTILTVVAVASVGVVAWDLATGVIYVTVLGIPFSSWEVAKPLRYASVCAALAICLRDRTESVLSWDVVS